MKPPKDLDEFRERLIEFSGKLIEAVQDADDPKMATFYMIQAKKHSLRFSTARALAAHFLYRFFLPLFESLFYSVEKF